MSSAAMVSPAAEALAADGPGDVLVVFGITGDLAKVMTFRSLYRLEARGLLDCPIVGVAVDDWSVDDLRERARTSIEGTGEQIDTGGVRPFRRRLSYVSGDFADPATYERVGAAIEGKTTPVFYLEIPPFLFGQVVKELADAGLTRGARSSSRSRSDTISSRLAHSPRSCTSTSTSPSCSASITTSGRWGSTRSSICGSRTRFSSRSGIATTSLRSRSRWPSRSGSRIAATSTTRSERCATSWSTT